MDSGLTFRSVGLSGRVDHLGGMLVGAAQRLAAEPVAALCVACPVPDPINHSFNSLHCITHKNFTLQMIVFLKIVVVLKFIVFLKFIVVLKFIVFLKTILFFVSIFPT